MLRAATINDLDELVQLGERMHSESPAWSRLTYSPGKVRDFLGQLIVSEGGLVQVATERGVVVGAVVAVCDQHWSSEDLIVAELALFVVPEVRGKLHAAQLVLLLQGWATVMGAKLVRAGSTTGVEPELAARLYTRLGFVRTHDVQLEYLCTAQQH